MNDAIPEKDFFSKLLVVVVLYKLRLNECPALSTLEKSAELMGIKLAVAVFDNGDKDQAKEIPAFSFLQINYIKNLENLGVSASYNKGLKIAEDKKLEWLLLIDQDFNFTDNLLKVYKDAQEENPLENIFCPELKCNDIRVSPFKDRFFYKENKQALYPGKQPIGNLIFLNNSLLVSTSAFKKTGGFNPKIPLYFSDFYFTKKLKETIGTFVLLPISVNHNLSAITTKDVKSADERFSFFLKGAKEYAKFVEKKTTIFVWCFFRACKLTLKYKTFDFISSFINLFILNKL
jgi:GT2 family glycosyltransferase